MQFTISHIDEHRKGFSGYSYQICKDGEPFATFTHNFRGECENLSLVDDSFSEDLPFGTVHHFVSGGGGLPFELTEKALVYLRGLVS